MKNKKTLFIISSSILAVLIAVVVFACAAGTKANDTPKTTPETEGSIIDASDVNIEEPETDELTMGIATTELTTVPDDGNALTIPDEPAPVFRNEGNEQEDIEEIAKPITERMPQDDGNGGVTVGDVQPEVYNCGSPGHHCDGPETHAYILNLELEGCPYCHKSDCPSFYATDEWGNTCYTPSKCLQYDIRKDPVYYCQICGKKCGDGSNGTCVQFVTACNCPDCGKHVEARTCHSCEN